MGRLLLGLIKGVVAGGIVGGAAFALGLQGGWGYPIAIAAGFLVGLIAGRPVWRHALDPSGTVWTAILKALFGAGLGALGFLALRKLAVPTVHLFDVHASLRDLPLLWAPALGAVLGAWFELDDAPSTGAKKK